MDRVKVSLEIRGRKNGRREGRKGGRNARNVRDERKDGWEAMRER